MLWEINFYKVLEVPCHQDLATTDLFHLHNRNQEMEGIEGNLAMKAGQGGCLAHCHLPHWCKGSLWCRITGRRGLPEVSHSFPGQTKLYWSKRGFWQKASCRPWQLERTEAQWKHRNYTRGTKKICRYHERCSIAENSKMYWRCRVSKSSRGKHYASKMNFCDPPIPNLRSAGITGVSGIMPVFLVLGLEPGLPPCWANTLPAELHPNTQKTVKF